jgi:hypothetical protein
MMYGTNNEVVQIRDTSCGRVMYVVTFIVGTDTRVKRVRNQIYRADVHSSARIEVTPMATTAHAR